VVQAAKNPTTAEVNANRVVYLSPHTGHQLYASADTGDTSLPGFLLLCRRLLAQGATVS
jgi:hypothetical protein